MLMKLMHYGETVSTSGHVFLLNKQKSTRMKSKASCISASFSFVLASIRDISNFVYTSQNDLWAGEHSRYSNRLRAGRSGDRIPVGGEIFRTCLDRPWGPSSLLYNGYRVFPGGKEQPGSDADPSSPSSAVGHERVELNLYSPYGPYGLYRVSVPVQGCILPLPILRTVLDYSGARGSVVG